MKKTLKMKTTEKNEDDLKNENDLKNEDGLKNEDSLKIEDNKLGLSCAKLRLSCAKLRHSKCYPTIHFQVESLLSRIGWVVLRLIKNKLCLVGPLLQLMHT